MYRAKHLPLTVKRLSAAAEKGGREGGRERERERERKERKKMLPKASCFLDNTMSVV